MLPSPWAFRFKASPMEIHPKHLSATMNGKINNEFFSPWSEHWAGRDFSVSRTIFLTVHKFLIYLQIILRCCLCYEWLGHSYVGNTVSGTWKHCTYDFWQHWNTSDASTVEQGQTCEDREVHEDPGGGLIDPTASPGISNWGDDGASTDTGSYTMVSINEAANVKEVTLPNMC